ncbi:uncharacterized protein LOC128193643 isoform X2 [Vigna angularis]|uniref:uncharacterized protein LOC128193643 isoform X2 n=1 Tax=Phaseolus angularis TaxID=3914 RepID=UPI0022B2C9FF|nr:uncharacterized protein LOC128193643 isoform X2 [Vigna angularis]
MISCWCMMSARMVSDALPLFFQEDSRRVRAPEEEAEKATREDQCCEVASRKLGTISLTSPHSHFLCNSMIGCLRKCCGTPHCLHQRKTQEQVGGLNVGCKKQFHNCFLSLPITLLFPFPDTNTSEVFLDMASLMKQRTAAEQDREKHGSDHFLRNIHQS